MPTPGVARPSAADDAARDGCSDAEGVADGQHQIADLKQIGIREGEVGELDAGILDLQNREVGALVLEQHLGVELADVRESHLDLGAGIALHDVVVGHDHAVWRHDHAEAERALQPLALAELPAEELLQEWIAEALPHALAHIDVHDGRSCPLYHGGVRKRDLLFRVRRLLHGLGEGGARRHREKEPEHNQCFGGIRSFHEANPV